MPLLELQTHLSLKNILFATDFSESSEHALPFAVALGKRFGAKIFLTHVIAPEARMPIPMETMPEDFDPVRYHAERAMTRFTRTSQTEGVTCEPLLETGGIETVFARVLADHKIDLVVAATRGRGGLKKLVLGSFAEEIFRSVSCPVLTIGPEVKQKGLANGVVKRVLYASDFTSGSQHALPYALALTRDYDADLTLLHVLENADQMAMYYREASMDDSLKELEALVPADVQLPHPPEFVVRAGQAAERIVDLAVDADASVIVIGVRAHGSAKLRAHLPWATAHQVVCHAPCPVLTVRGPAQ